MKYWGPLNSGVAAGGAGVATNNATSTVVLAGRVLAIYVRYNDNPPAGTTDVTIETAGTDGPPSLTILTLTDAATDGYFYPRHQVHTEAGAGITYDGANEVYEPVPIHDKVKVTIAQADNSDSVDVWFLLE